MTLPGSRRRGRQVGYFLLEVLVAFAILSLSLGVLLQVIAVGLRNTAVAEEYTQARLYAESLLTALRKQSLVQAAVEEGQLDERFYWRSSVTPYNQVTQTPGLTPYRLSIEVFWRGPRQARSVMLETLRLVPSDTRP